MMQFPSTRMDAVQTPIIPVVADLIRQHPGTISLGQGVAYYGPPAQAIAAISTFLAQPDNHKYQSVQGILPLRQAIATKLKTENGINLEGRQIVVTAGSNMGFLNAVLAITQPGDEIILQVPYYFNHEMAVAIAGCRVVLVPTDDQYHLQVDVLERTITEHTRGIVTISPNNPTGVVYCESTLRKVNQLCRDRRIYHIHDETYEYFTYNGASHFSPGAISDSTNHTICLYSLSKAYGFASWRIGYMVIPDPLLSPVMKIQDTNAICPPVISQYAAIGAIEVGATYCRERLGVMEAVRHQMLDRLHSIPHLCTVPPANGAFYFLLRIHTDLTSMELVERLVRDYGVAAIPGDTFGMDQGCYLRVAYGALEPDTASEGIDRLVRGLQDILH